MQKKDKVSTANELEGNGYSKQVYISQEEIPAFSLEETICVARTLYDNFAGKSTSPLQLAMALDSTTGSSKFRKLCGASIAYGLTSGGYNARVIALTELGRRIVAPTEEGDDLTTKVEASLKPSIASKFFTRYNNAKFPVDKIAKNVLSEMGVPNDRLDQVLEILRNNGLYVGIIHRIKTGLFVSIETPPAPSNAIESVAEVEEQKIGEVKEKLPIEKALPEPISVAKKERVFIAHGKNLEIVSQLKDLLKFGKFIPVVAEEQETTSKPVPEKVLADMRSCFAGIIHISSEDELLDRSGKVHHKINENVLIEIGAALALYDRNFILLVQEGIHLPSNLQGLYVCYYTGEKLDYEATMKLLKAFSEFK